ncbi:MAG: UPF0176 protein [Flavobacteriales bacterium]|jgi:UPF0176 protein
MLQSSEERYTLSLYQYYQIGNPNLFRDYLFIHWNEFDVFGRIYVSNEGINAQISVPVSKFDAWRDDLYQITFLDGIRLNKAIEDDGKSFYKLKIKVREKIVADGLNDETFDVTNTGKHLNAEEFNKLTDEDDTILIDMRNHYEHEVGHFEGAILPDVDTFREELIKVRNIVDGKNDKNIVMYCTGGIRCEKASAWLKHEGFPNVHQLNGGIIEYARQVDNKGLKNKFKGKNFVFDERLGERISDEIISSCHQCGEPSDDHTNCVNEGCHLLFIQCSDCKKKMENTCSHECHRIIHLSEEEQKDIRKNTPKKVNIFKKGRSENLPFMKKN